MSPSATLNKIENKISYPYEEYSDLVVMCAEYGLTTGKDQPVERIAATRLNATRMKRISKQGISNQKLIRNISAISTPQVWVLFAESWCGDGAQNIPIIANIASYSKNIELRILLRDQNLDLMDNYLTNGSRSIPKLICIERESGRQIASWGPRSSLIQQLVKEFKAKKPDVLHEEFLNNLHLWYSQDKGISLQKDFEILFTPGREIA